MSSYTLLDGTRLAKEREQLLAQKIATTPTKPTLVIIQVGNNKASTKYIDYKKRCAGRMGAIVHHILLTETTTTEELVTEIQKYNQDASIHGIIIQLPLPPHCVVHTVLNAVDPKKDVDGMTGENIRLLYENKSMYIPATSLGILTLLEHYRIACAGKHVVIVGRSSLVGKPTALALLNNDATVTIAHSKTQDLKTITRTADILISATGSAKFINSNHLKAGAIVIDVGITVTDDGHVVGDVDLHDAQEKVSAISPVPGGVGPMTIISLFENLYKAYETNRK